MTDEAIRKAVEQRYSNIAETFKAEASCCSTEEACDCGSSLYDPATLDDLPVDVTGLSLGCGDPVAIASLKPGETVLDLGSGGGLDCFLAARQVGTEGHVIGVDMTPAMLEKARANRAKTGLTNVEFRQGQLESLPVEGDSVDVILSNCVINLVPDKRLAFAEAFRVLKPGGRVSISDIVTEGEFTEEMRNRFDLWSECTTGAIDVDEYTGLMETVGFTDVQVVSKVDAQEAMPEVAGLPRIYSARITAHKPLV